MEALEDDFPLQHREVPSTGSVSPNGPGVPRLGRGRAEGAALELQLGRYKDAGHAMEGLHGAGVCMGPFGGELEKVQWGEHEWIKRAFSKSY